MIRFLLIPAVLLCAVSGLAQEGNTLAQPVPTARTIPKSRDVAFPGVMELKVDASVSLYPAGYFSRGRQ